MKNVNFSILIGKTLSKIEVCNDVIDFLTTCGKHYQMYHERDCCESVHLEDISGIPIQDLIGYPVLIADERTNSGKSDEDPYSFTWTFYELATINGAVTIRWYGTSNGYYSEKVSFLEVESSETV